MLLLRRLFFSFAFLGWSVLGAGCVTLPWIGKKAPPPTPPADSMVLRGGDGRTGKAEAAIDPNDPAYVDLEAARKLHQEGKHREAERAFHKLAENNKNPMPILEEARYYEAESQRLQGDYRNAEATYKRLMKDFRTGRYTDQANRRLFDIANYWLDDTRELMAAYEEKREGKRFFVFPTSFMHFGKDKPFLDTEGHAVQAMEEVRLNDINGPLGEKALFYLATVKFFREDYREADYYYTQLYQNYPNSALAPKAVKQAIVCKQIVNGGSEYDTRTLVDAQKLLDTAQRAYPSLANKEDEWIRRQLTAINLQQADRDLKIADFYKRTGHNGSAYFYYELVKRRYPGTSYYKEAVARMDELKTGVEQERRQMQQQPGGNTGMLAGFWNMMRGQGSPDPAVPTPPSPSAVVPAGFSNEPKP